MSYPHRVKTKLAFVLFGASVIGCGQAFSDRQSAEQTYVGALGSTGALLAVTTNGDRFRAYVCGDDATRAIYTQWFEGSMSNGQAVAKGGELLLSIDQRDSTRVVGSIERNGSKVTFDLGIPHAAGGLWSAKGEHCATGLIALDDGRTQGAYCVAPFVRSQVVPVRPPARGDEEVAVYISSAQLQEWLKRVSINVQ